MKLPTLSQLIVAGTFALTSASITPAVADEKVPEPASGEAQTSDPLEDINRITFGFNSVVRGILLDPLVDGYQAVTPSFLQEAIGNAASNLTEPVTAVSSFLQGDTENAEKATQRFFVNSTIGMGGLNDPATEMGIEQRREDLGQAAAVNGAEEGMYIVLPLFGPSNTRDAIGDALTAVASPMPLIGAVAQGGVEYSSNQDDIQTVTKGALDPYVVERNAYSQYRKYQINNGTVEAQDSPTLDAEDLK
jgi:phospholipid-binding lipoprotein MlaA